MVAEGDLVSARFVFTGTHQGEFMGVPATGKRVEVEGFDLVRVRDGRATEHWGQMDAMALMQQLGAIPAEAPA
jgi:predicted ester cyclase